MNTNSYDYKKIEKKWQHFWAKEKLWQAVDFGDVKKFPKGKSYLLVEFPYPSGEGLHVGHPRSYTAMDVIARKRRMEGYDVLYPIGFDAFGLPSENYAIKAGVHPSITTKKNIKTFTKQLKSLGLSFDWSREIKTTDPKYYKWTQWIFLELFKKGLAYKAKIPINWCKSCKIGLANEEVVDGKCERCEGEIEKREKEQWMIKITKYADRLVDDLDKVDYLEKIKIQQQNWIGRSKGLEEDWEVDGMDFKISTFTTWPHTTWGATFMVIAPEHPLIDKLVKNTKYAKGAKAFAKKAVKDKIDNPVNVEKNKEGFFTGRYAINHLTGWKMPIYIANFAVFEYGTGIVKCTPTHDQRDFEFAKKYDLKFVPVIKPKNSEPLEALKMKEAYIGEGVMMNAGKFTGLTTDKARGAVAEHTLKEGHGRRITNYKLRDWVFSRQHYWGEPIPMVYCEACAKKKYTYVLIHGYYDASDHAWLKWAEKELKKQGHEVVVLDLPNPKNPNVDEQVDFLLERIKIDENTVLVGHSLGGCVALKLLDKANQKVSKVVLVDSFIRPEFSDEARKAVENSCDWEFNFKKLKSLSDEFIILSDQNYSVVTPGQDKEMSDLLEGRLVVTEPLEPHFRGKKEPSVLEQLKNDGWVPLPEDQLPLELPKVEKYQPMNTGESPLAAVTDWVDTTCPVCGEAAKRETDTMPNWAGSNWYFLRYTDPKNNKALADPEKLKFWMAVDWYNGGMEHTTLHLLYSRFIYKFLWDIEAVPKECGPEPYIRRTSHGMILGEGGEKMSKSRGNVINPDDIVKEYGADTLRTYEMFMGPFDQAIPWSTNGVVGMKRFLERVWNLYQELDMKLLPEENRDLTKFIHQTIRKVSSDIEGMKFNTAIAQLMMMLNEMTDKKGYTKKILDNYLILLSPFAPHIVEELWELLGNSESIFKSKWPKHDENLAKLDRITLVFQVNGKVRGKIDVEADISEDNAKDKAMEDLNVAKHLKGKEVKKVIFVPGKLVNFVVK